MKKLLLVIVIILALLAAAGVYLLKPKTLGTTYSAEDLAFAKQKLGITYQALAPEEAAGKTIIVSGSHPVNKTFTNEELTALADNRYKDYAYFPFRNVQIRVNPDGTIEGSAKINYTDAVNYLAALGISQQAIAEGAAKFNLPKTSLPVYLKVAGSVVNNRSQITIAAAQIANLAVPQNLVQQYQPALNHLIESIIADRQPSYNIAKLETINGAVHFLGTSPDTEMAAKSVN